MSKYWSTVEENLVVEYKNETNQINKERILNKLYPKLRIMSEAIIFRYYSKYVNEEYAKDIDEITDGISQAILAIDKFDPSKGTKAYSYLQTVIKRYYFSLFVRPSNNETIFNESLMNNGIFDAESESHIKFFGYEDDNILNLEIVDNKKKVLNYLKSIYLPLKEEYEHYDSFSPYKRKKNNLKRPKFRRFDLLYYELMIDKLEEMKVFTFEGWIINILNELSDQGFENFIKFFKRAGFDSKGVYGVFHSYIGRYGKKGKGRELKDNFDWMFDDYPPEWDVHHTNNITSKRYYKTKRGKYKK